MTPQESRNLVLAVARTLFINGQSTDEIAAAAERVGRSLGLHAWITPRWGQIQLHGEDSPMSTVVANPTGVDMGRVATVMRTVEDVEAGRLAPQSAQQAIAGIAKA